MFINAIRCRILNVFQVPLESFLVALKFMKVDDVDADEVACIVANLIYQVYCTIAENNNSLQGYCSGKILKFVF